MYKVGDVVKYFRFSGKEKDMTDNSYYEVVIDEDDHGWVGVIDDAKENNNIPAVYFSLISEKCNSEVFEICEEDKFSINMSISKAGDDDSFLRFDHLSMTKQQMIDTINQMWGSV